MGHENLSAKEAHSYRELCVNIFDTTLKTAMYAQRPITQADIDGLPQLVRLASEKKIKELGYSSHIDFAFRLQAIIHRRLGTIIEEGLYYRALEGSAPIDFFKGS